MFNQKGFISGENKTRNYTGTWLIWFILTFK
jgi:hypothetical protein